MELKSLSLEQFLLKALTPTNKCFPTVAFTLRQITQRKMVVYVLKNKICFAQTAKSSTYYAASYTLCECGLQMIQWIPISNYATIFYKILSLVVAHGSRTLI